MLKLTFITGNPKKLEQAKLALGGQQIEVVNQKIDVPEIQDTDIQKVAEFSARFAADKLQTPVVVTDAGYYIKALNGFPGPFIKFINQWFSPSDLLRLMEGVEDRSIESPVCVTYCEPGTDPVSFISQNYGSVALEAKGEGSTIDQLYIPQGKTDPIGTLPEAEKLTIWNTDCWKKLAEYLTNKQSPTAKPAQ